MAISRGQKEAFRSQNPKPFDKVQLAGVLARFAFDAFLSLRTDFALVLPMLHRSWQWSFVFWAVPVVLIAVAIFVLAPRSEAGVAAAPRRWMRWPSASPRRSGRGCSSRGAASSSPRPSASSDTARTR